MEELTNWNIILGSHSKWYDAQLAWPNAGGTPDTAIMHGQMPIIYFACAGFVLWIWGAKTWLDLAWCKNYPKPSCVELCIQKMWPPPVCVICVPQEVRLACSEPSRPAPTTKQKTTLAPTPVRNPHTIACMYTFVFVLVCFNYPKVLIKVFDPPKCTIFITGIQKAQLIHILLCY